MVRVLHDRGTQSSTKTLLCCVQKRSSADFEASMWRTVECQSSDVSEWIDAIYSGKICGMQTALLLLLHYWRHNGVTTKHRPQSAPLNYMIVSISQVMDRTLTEPRRALWTKLDDEWQDELLGRRKRAFKVNDGDETKSWRTDGICKALLYFWQIAQG